MGVGGVRGGGKKGGAGGARGAGASGGAGKASGAGFAGRVERKEGVSGAEGAGPAGGAGGASGVAQADPVSAQAMEIARQLKAGQISGRDEATKKLVADILKQKLRMQSKALTQRIADALQDDPHLNQTLERLWSSADAKE